jgi:hypothetical protein
MAATWQAIMNRFLSAQDIASTVFGTARGLPLNRHVKPDMQISDEALRATAAGGSADAGMGARLSTTFQRTAHGNTGTELARQFPSNVQGDRAREIALKQMFNANT